MWRFAPERWRETDNRICFCAVIDQVVWSEADRSRSRRAAPYKTTRPRHLCVLLLLFTGNVKNLKYVPIVIWFSLLLASLGTLANRKLEVTQFSVVTTQETRSICAMSPPAVWTRMITYWLWSGRFCLRVEWVLIQVCHNSSRHTVRKKGTMHEIRRFSIGKGFPATPNRLIEILYSYFFPSCCKKVGALHGLWNCADVSQGGLDFKRTHVFYLGGGGPRNFPHSRTRGGGKFWRPSYMQVSIKLIVRVDKRAYNRRPNF